MEGDAEEYDMEDSGLDNELIRQEAWAICRVRELAKACARLSGRLLPTAVEKAARRIARFASRAGGLPGEPEPLTALEVAALQTALQEATAASVFVHMGEPTHEGVAAVEQLAQQALEGIDLSRPVGGGLVPWLETAGGGGGSEEGISVELLVRVGPERVSALSSAFACVLRRTLTSRNCFSVLLLARRLGCSMLTEEALLACIANFPAAVRADKRHFLMLDDSLLLLITSNSNLQVLEELEVWQAIAEWVQHAWESRRCHLYDLLQAGVRLSHLDTLQLSQLQRHPLLVAEPGPGAQLVSAAYSARILSNVHQSRSRQRGSVGTGVLEAGIHAHPAAHAGPVPSQQQVLQYTRSSLSQPQQPSHHHHQQQQQQQQQPERPKPHAALQQLIGSLQARAAAAKARQQQQLLLQQQQQQQQPQQQPQQQQGTIAIETGKEVQERSGLTGGSSSTALSRSPISPAGATPPVVSAGVANPLISAKQDPETSPRPSVSPTTVPQSLQQQRRPSQGPLSQQTREVQGGASGGSADKRQLASALAQAIAKAAAKQGLPRIQVGAGGQITPGAVQAALSAAQKQIAANPQLQEMLREAKAQIAQPSPQHALRPQQSEHAAPPGGGSPEDQQQQDQHHRLEASSSGAGTKPSLSSPGPLASPASSPSPRVISHGIASQLPLSGSHLALIQPLQQEPGRPAQPQQPMALAPQQLLQIAAAVQKAVRSGQPQPPHVRHQLQQLQAFISRQLAATPPGSSQQPLLLALQSMLAGAATSTDTSPHAGHHAGGLHQPALVRDQPLLQRPQVAERQPRLAQGSSSGDQRELQHQQQEQQEDEGIMHAEGSRVEEQDDAHDQCGGGQGDPDKPHADATPSDGAGGQLARSSGAPSGDGEEEEGVQSGGFGREAAWAETEPEPKRRRQH
ncbi:hypothetical protein VaNZ11_004051 [Volvox africanus]|uniref:BACK domain-containing protein n=1 Tax=Volvox africanus TaxID=51714 RepID=A0ABQ5RVM6_9CHLO|nr:hypothetical protein VaNZ11_004051 [Volvox africanus]